MNNCPQKKLLSLIVPVFNEEENIETFLKTVSCELDKIAYNLEIIFIDDGSADKTFERIKFLISDFPCVRVIKFSRNFGKEAALTAGLDFAKGDAIIPIDVDLQDPPSVIIEFIQKWEEGAKTVFGVRRSRNEDSIGKSASAGIFYRLFNSISDHSIPRNAGDFRLIDRKVVDIIKQMPERNRFMKGLFSWPGFKTAYVEYDRPIRSSGKSKFNAWKLWNFALDGITSFSTLPLRAWAYVGSVIAIFSLIYMAFIIIRTLVMGVGWPGYASLMAVILFLGAVQLISIGVIGEYIGRLYLECKRRPIYIVEEE